MTASERTFLDTLQRDTKGRIVYTLRRATPLNRFSASVAALGRNGVLYPWLSREECQRQAKRFKTTAVFVESNVGFAA